MINERVFEEIHNIWIQALMSKDVPLPDSTYDMHKPHIFLKHALEWTFEKENAWRISSQSHPLTREVYQIDVVDLSSEEHTRWVNRGYTGRYQANNFEYQIDTSHISLVPDDDPEELLYVARDLVEGITYNDDGTVNIPLDLSDEEFLYIARAAHELDITINEFMTRTIEEHINQVENDDEY